MAEIPFRARTRVEFVTHSGERHPAGTEVMALEGLPLDASEPKAYIVEVAVPDESLVGGFRFDIAELAVADLERAERLVAEVPHTQTVGVMHPHDGSLPEEKRTVQVFPERGRLYLAGVSTFAVDDDADLRLTILHPRTRRPLLHGNRDIHAVSLNPDVRSRKWMQFESYADLFIPLWGTRNDDANLEPTYCSKDLPLLVEVQGDAVLYLLFLGADHYTVTRWPAQLPSPFSYPEPLGEFRGPYGATPSSHTSLTQGQGKGET